MYLKRKIDKYLADWKANENRKPLIIKGPRQIGKTESINKFAENNYESVIEINFVLYEKYKIEDRIHLPYMLKMVEKSLKNKDIELWKLASKYQ